MNEQSRDLFDANMYDINMDEQSRDLYDACKDGDFEGVKGLKNVDVDLNIKGKYEKVLLYLACRDGHLKIVEFLVNDNIDLNIKSNIIKNTALHYACNEGHLNIVKILVNAGLDFNLENYWGFSPLMYAKIREYENIVEFLKNYTQKLIKATSSKKQIKNKI